MEGREHPEEVYVVRAAFLDGKYFPRQHVIRVYMGDSRFGGLGFYRYLNPDTLEVLGEQSEIKSDDPYATLKRMTSNIPTHNPL